MKPYRQLLFNAFAKLGAENQAQLMGYYDILAPRLGEEQAISLMHEAFLQLHSAVTGRIKTSHLWAIQNQPL
jgi:hypothetical protein